jgi:hypothetical protein
VQRGVLVAGALLWLAAGVAQVAYQSRAAARTPGWAPVLAPLAAAPIPSGAAVALLEPIGTGPGQAKPLLYEAAWQRPDLHWAFLSSFKDQSPAALVAVGTVLPPSGWREAWRQGAITVYRRIGP